MRTTGLVARVHCASKRLRGVGSEPVRSPYRRVLTDVRWKQSRRREGSVWDAEDRRLVQTGVVGHPGSDDPVAMPTGADEARQFRAEYRNATFWCGELLGGCGRQLATKIYVDRVCHFAHLASSDGHCGRAHRGQDSADHLYISRALKSLPGGLLTEATPAFDFDRAAPAGTACTGLTFTHRGESAANLIVQLADFDSRETCARIDEEHQRAAPGTQWLFAEHSKAVWWAVAKYGHGFRIKCEQRGNQRQVMIETVLEDCVPRWSDATECWTTENGLWTPHLEVLRRAATPAAQDPVPGITLASQLPAPSTSLPRDSRPQSPLRGFRKGLTGPEVDQEWSRIKSELQAARAAHDRARVRSLVGEGRRLSHACAKTPPWLLYELGEYETWLTATTPLRQAPPERRNGGAGLAPVPRGAMDLADALARAGAAGKHQQVVALGKQLRELLDRSPEEEAGVIRRVVLSRYEDQIRRSQGIVDRAKQRSERDRARAQRRRETTLDRAASVVRDLLNRVARDQLTVTWAQLRRRAVELADLSTADESEVLRRVDAGLAPGAKRLSALVRSEEGSCAARPRKKKSS